MELTGWESFVTVFLGILFLIFEVSGQYRRSRRRRRMSFGGYVLVISIFLIFSAVIYFCYGLWYDWYWEKGPAIYADVNAAAADGCVVISIEQPVAGAENWEDFLAKTQMGQAAQISIAHSEGDAVYAVDVLIYDGVLYHYTKNSPYLHRASTVQTYPYLLRLSHDPNDLYESKISWVLTDKADLTVQELPEILYGDAQSYIAEVLLAETVWRP